MSKRKDWVENIDGRCSCLAARQASRYLTAVYDQALAPADLRITQFSILYKLAKSDALTIGELATAMAMDRTTLASNLKPLEREGLIDMVPGEDRRVKKAMITEAGVARFRKALPLWRVVQERFEKSFGVKNAEELRNSLRTVLGSGFDPWAENGVN
ncbi:MarR family transcriptional regulator [Paraburkholderia guartelaensis]|uniref:MarR family transcriptional regulator n=1 Tax=Paraburkholderia guartelaensis TaxID=2546446 RepID=A0A4R5L8T7_9BURK|nr:MarR family winged helix-turn-helix transcriptional regulator [Paraburkholderia guartelaensis]TDG04506.1 MarR family transcriptional regulator [Paraburkholderia guartelaensis]